MVNVVIRPKQFNRVQVSGWVECPKEPADSLCDVSDCFNSARYCRRVTLGSITYDQVACSKCVDRDGKA